MATQTWRRISTCIAFPGDIAAPLDTVPISPLTVGGRKSLMEDMEPLSCSLTNISSPDSNDDDGSRESSDSAIELLHAVHEDGIQDFTVAGDEPLLQSTLSTSTIPIHLSPTQPAPAPSSSPSSPPDSFLRRANLVTAQAVF